MEKKDERFFNLQCDVQDFTTSYKVSRERKFLILENTLWRESANNDPFTLLLPR